MLCCVVFAVCIKKVLSVLCVLFVLQVWGTTCWLPNLSTNDDNVIIGFGTSVGSGDGRGGGGVCHRFSSIRFEKLLFIVTRWFSYRELLHVFPCIFSRAHLSENMIARSVVLYLNYRSSHRDSFHNYLFCYSKSNLFMVFWEAYGTDTISSRRPKLVVEHVPFFLGRPVYIVLEHILFSWKPYIFSLKT